MCRSIQIHMLKFVVPGGRAAVQGKRRRRAGVTTRVLCIDIGVHNMGVAELEREGSSPPALEVFEALG